MSHYLARNKGAPRIQQNVISHQVSRKGCVLGSAPTRNEQVRQMVVRRTNKPTKPNSRSEAHSARSYPREQKVRLCCVMLSFLCKTLSQRILGSRHQERWNYTRCGSYLPRHQSPLYSCASLRSSFPASKEYAQQLFSPPTYD